MVMRLLIKSAGQKMPSNQKKVIAFMAGQSKANMIQQKISALWGGSIFRSLSYSILVRFAIKLPFLPGFYTFGPMNFFHRSGENVRRSYDQLQRFFYLAANGKIIFTKCLKGKNPVWKYRVFIGLGITEKF